MAGHGGIRGAWTVVMLAAVAVGCRAHGEDTGAAFAATPPAAIAAHMPTGPLAGVAVSAVRPRVTDPYDGNPTAIAEGQRLYIQMNCAYCHGFSGNGGMGPNLADNYWRFGGDDADIFLTIWGGRGKGMPAWQNLLTDDQIWKLVAYIHTLSGAPVGVSERGGEAGGKHAKTQAQGGAGVAEGSIREPLKGRNENEP